jgi:hypothetical protein
MVYKKGDNAKSEFGGLNDETFGGTSQIWTVADAFTKLKIFKPMFECDTYEIISKYGTENIFEQILPEQIPLRRIEGLFRFKDCLRLIFENSNFIIQNRDRQEFNNLRKHLDFIELIMSGVSRIEYNAVTKNETLVINEAHFQKCLRALSKIKEQLHVSLNNASIIFKQTDELSFEELLNDIAEGG